MAILEQDSTNGIYFDFRGQSRNPLLQEKLVVRGEAAHVDRWILPGSMQPGICPLILGESDAGCCGQDQSSMTELH